MTRPVNYDSTMLLRLSAEMKQAFYAACSKARGVVPSEHARQLITDYVLNHWGVDKPKSSDTIALERCDTTLDMFPADDQPPAEIKPPVRPPVRPNRPKKKKKALKIYNRQVNYLPIFCLSVYYGDIHKPKKGDFALVVLRNVM